MKVCLALALAVVLLVTDCSISAGSPIPSGFGGLPDLGNLGHGFGAKIGNIIKGSTYDGLDRALKKMSLNRHKVSSEDSDDDSATDGGSMFGFSGKQFEQLISILQESQSGGQKQPSAPAAAVPFAAIDNSVD